MLLLNYTVTVPSDDHTRPASTRYEQRTPSRDGIGKIYMGREISHVMGHQGAEWLERSEREEEEMPNRLVEMLKLKEGDVVADIGIGTGYIARRISPKIGETGIIYGVEIQQEMLDILAEDGGSRDYQYQRDIRHDYRSEIATELGRFGDYGGCLPRIFTSV